MALALASRQDLLGLCPSEEHLSNSKTELNGSTRALACDDVAVHNSLCIRPRSLWEFVGKLRVRRDLGWSKFVLQQHNGWRGAHSCEALLLFILRLQHCGENLTVLQMRRTRHASREDDRIPLLTSTILDFAIS